MITLIENIALPSVQDGKTLEDTARAVLDFSKQTREVDLSVVIEDDEMLKDLNRQYRNIDAPTDVLSFQANELDPSTGILYLGDVIISLEQASRQAEKSGHALIAELQLLTIHGTLHLLGYDHADEIEKKSMWDAQTMILKSLGVELAVWPEG